MVLRPLRGRIEITDRVTGDVASLNPRLIAVTPAGVELMVRVQRSAVVLGYQPATHATGMWASTYSAMLVGSGIGEPPSFNPSR